MKNVYKLLILLISFMVVSYGSFAQSDLSPKLKNQLEEKVKPQKSTQELKVIEAQEVAPTPEQMIMQRMEQDGTIANVTKKGEGNSGPTDDLCAPVFSSGCAVGDGFTDFAVEEIENYGSGCADLNGVGWSQYFGLGPATLVPGFTHTFTMGTGYSSQHVNIWIDFNDDDVLDLDEMILYDYVLEAAGTLYDVDIAIPANATPGEHKMRAMAVWITTFDDPCGSYSYGEAEDYMVDVIVPDYGNLEGYVTENTGGAAVEGATVSVNGGMYTATTGSDGYYSIDDVLVGDWPIACTKTGYNPNTGGTVTIEVGVTVEYDFAMTAPTMEIEPTSISITIDPFAQATEYIDISNNGDGMLGWSAQLEMLTEGTEDMFDVLLDVPVGVGGGEAGIETDGVNIYTSMWNGAGEFQQYDMEGNWLGTVTVPGSAGCRDIAFDGTYFYGGAASTTIFEMDIANGTMISTFTGPAACRAIAYNENDDAFYCNNWSDNVTKFDKTGANLGSFPVGPVGISYYGFAYDNYSGGEYLWGYAQTGATTNELIQMELPSGVETGLTFDVGSVTNVGVGTAGGLAIDDHITMGLWAILGTSQNENIWALELGPAGAVWISIDPTNGDVDPGNMGQMAVHFDATDIVAGTVKTANIHFTSDPEVGMVTVPVSMTVGNLDFGYVEGNVFLDGMAAYNIGEITEVLVEVGPYSGYPDANGDYSIETYPGTYDVTATLYGYTQQIATGIVVDEGATVSGIDFTMPCILGKLYGTATDEDGGAAIENVTITIMDTDFETMTDANGNYEFFLEAGTYDVEADHPTYAVMVATDVVVNIEEDTEQDFVMTYQCIFCDASGGGDEYLDGVEFGTISNLSTGYQTGYVDYTSLSTVVIPGMQYTLTIHTGNMYASDDYGVWIDWNMDCTFDPSTENVVCGIDMGAAINTWEITIPANATPGLATMRVRLKYSPSDCGDPCGATTYGEVEDYSIIITPGTYGNLEGIVTESGSGDPIEGAEINVANMYYTTTLSDGSYEIMDVLTGTWDVYCSMEGYNPEMGSATILEGQTTTLNFELTAPEFSVEPTALSVTLDPNATVTETITINNPGTGTVDWSASLVVAGDNGDDMFDVLLDVPVGVGGGEAGIETDGTYIYTSMWNGGGEFQRYAMDGTWMETITVAGSAGCRDIAYDGTYFYGAAAATTIFEMDLANAAMISTFTGPAACRAVAYNENEDVFYCNNWSDNVTKFDKSGANLGSFPVGPVGVSYYGFAYDNYSGGEYLWGYAQTGATTNELIQMELPSGVETGLTFDVGSVTNVGAGTAGGLSIDDHIASGKWALLGTSQNENIWALELADAQTWITIAPTSGSLDPGSNETMDVILDATGLLPGFYYADINFSTNPNVGSPTVTVELEVEGLIPAINLSAMYNCTDVDLSWEMPAGGTPDSWNVYRDGTLLGSADDMMYTDEMVDPEVEYSYTVTAVYGSDESFPTPAFLITVPIPEDLEPMNPDAVHIGAGDILISWEAPEACLAPDEYDVYRDGGYVGTTTDLEYTDEGLAVGFYEYYVVAVYYFGESGNSAPAYVLVGIGDISASEFQIFPNPASDLVNVKSDYHVNSIELLNNAGQVVYTKEVESSNFNINVSSFERGIYYFRMKTDDQVILRKIALK